jgi:hypothetical protein
MRCSGKAGAQHVDAGLDGSCDRSRGDDEVRRSVAHALSAGSGKRASSAPIGGPNPSNGFDNGAPR